MDISVVYFQQYKHPNPTEISFHSHKCHELVIYTQGEGSVEADGKIFKYRKNSIVIIPQGIMHNEINFHKCHNIAIGFNSNPDIVPFDIFQADLDVMSIIQNMLEEKSQQNKYCDEIISLQLYRLILMLLRTKLVSAPKPQIKKDFPLILKSIDNYIEENLIHQISISDFAEMYNYSADRFRHIFTENMGISLKQYIILKRIECAKILLTSSNKSITDISYECGFYDASQFSKLFKKICKITPSQFRNKYNDIF